jgi:hypothetical protein
MYFRRHDAAVLPFLPHIKWAATAHQRSGAYAAYHPDFTLKPVDTFRAPFRFLLLPLQFSPMYNS